MSGLTQETFSIHSTTPHSTTYHMIPIDTVRNNAMTYQAIGVDILSDFFAYLDVSEKTRATYQRALRQLFKYFTTRGVTKPAYEDMITFKQELQAKGRKASTIALYLASARKFFSWTEQRGIFPNIATGIKAPRQERGHKRDFLGATQLKQILADMRHDSLEQRRDYAVFMLMSVCGLRTIEVSRANIEDMRTQGDSVVLYVQGKGRNDRTEFVHLPAPLHKAITDYLSMRGKVSGTAPLFASIGNRNKGGRMTTRTISRIAKEAMKKAGYDSSRLSAHSLRHSAITLALLGGMSINEVKGMARHNSISTTEIYSHAVDRLKSICENTVCSMIV